MKKGIVALLVGIMIGISGCQQKGDFKAKKEIITLSAAASLIDCMEAIGEAFSENYPLIEIQFNFGSSGALQQQIEQGAPVDLFFSASMKQMEILEEKGLVDKQTILPVLKNKLALITPKGESQRITFEMLKEKPLERLAIGEVESVPVGQYALEVFKSLGIEKKVTPSLVYAKDVREVLSWVETGNVEAGIVYETDAKQSQSVEISDLADERYHTSIIYPLGIIVTSVQKQGVQDFVEFIGTEEAKEIFKEYGFTPID